MPQGTLAPVGEFIPDTPREDVVNDVVGPSQRAAACREEHRQTEDPDLAAAKVAWEAAHENMMAGVRRLSVDFGVGSDVVKNNPSLFSAEDAAVIAAADADYERRAHAELVAAWMKAPVSTAVQ